MSRLLLALSLLVVGCLDSRTVRVTGEAGGYRFIQGSLRATQSPTDLALEGPGFLAVSSNGARRFVRGGSFRLDDQGFFADPDGRHLQGRSGDGTLVPAYDRIEDLTAPPRHAMKATTFIALRVNLDSATPVLPLPFDVDDLLQTTNFVATVMVFDSVGQSHQVDVWFRIVRVGIWNWYAVVGGSDTGEESGRGFVRAAGQFTFNATGTLKAATADDYPWNFVGASPGQRIAWQFPAATLSGGQGTDSVTQFASPSVTLRIEQDGYGSGLLIGAEVERVGILKARYDNGQSRTIGYVPVVMFARLSDVLGIGNHVYVETPSSGPPLPAEPGRGGRADLFAGFLEDVQ